jgi:phosphatidyl-myo-inositol alpha-mannosyltransferase
MNAQPNHRQAPFIHDRQALRARRREVLIVCLARGLGGSTRSLVTVLGCLPTSFRRVLCTPAEGPFLRMLRSRGLVDGHLEIPNRGAGTKGKLSRFVAMFEILRWVHRHRRAVHVIHANGPEELNLVIPAALIYRVPVVVWSHARDVSPWMRRLRVALRPLVRRMDIRWAAVSILARDVLVEGGLATAERVKIVPNPIDPSDVVGNTRGGLGRTAENAGAASGRVTIGYLGSDAPYKGFLLLPDVVEALADAPVQWLVFSNERSSKSSAAWRRLRELSSERVSVVGKVAEVGDAYARCDIVFMPSLDESFGRVAAEAMLNGLPVVASDLPPVRDLLDDGRAGLLFPPGDVAGAAHCIRTLIDDREERMRLGGRGKVLAARFEPRTVVAELTALYEQDRQLIAR